VESVPLVRELVLIYCSPLRSLLSWFLGRLDLFTLPTTVPERHTDLPSWIFLSNGYGTWSGHDRLSILSIYGTTPMMLNLYVSFPQSFGGWNLSLTQPLSVLHIFAALHTIRNKFHISWETNNCPNCHHNVIRVSRSTADQDGGDKDNIRSSPHFYDDGARVSSEFQTSGFNTPRQSEETLASSTRTSGELL
jgi:hypothetical protein